MRWDPRYWRRLKAVILLGPLLVDCFVNMVLGDSFKRTLSAVAWRSREHKWWGWTHAAIDCLFALFGQKDHCEGAAKSEDAHNGNIWAAWAANFD